MEKPIDKEWLVLRHNLVLTGKMLQVPFNSMKVALKTRTMLFTVNSLQRLVQEQRQLGKQRDNWHSISL